MEVQIFWMDGSPTVIKGDYIRITLDRCGNRSINVTNENREDDGRRFTNVVALEIRDMAGRGAAERGQEAA